MVLSYSVSVVIGVVQSHEDIDTHRVRVMVTHLAAVWSVTTLGLAAALEANWSALPRMIVSGFMVWASLWLLSKVSGGGVGRGDLRLAPVIGWGLGFISLDAVVAGAVAFSVFGALWAVVALARQGRHARIPYVPVMYLGFLFGLISQG